VHENVYQTDTFSEHFSASEAAKTEGFQKPLNNKHKYNISNIDNKSDMELKKESVEKTKSDAAQKENEVIGLYRTICRSFPQIMQITGKRKEKILRRLSEMGGIKILEQVFRKMEASDFLKGNNKAGWKATFDWVFQNTDNWMKILEGNYDNHISKSLNDARFMGMLQTDISKF
jgi:hypothetical protein